MKSFLRFIRGVATSRYGLIMLTAHLLLVVFEFARKRPEYGDTSWIEFQQMGWDYGLIAARPFHWAYESILLQTISFLDLPGFLVGAFVSDFFFTGLYSRLSAAAASWIDAAIFLFFTSIQWLLIGYLIERGKQITKEI